MTTHEYLSTSRALGHRRDEEGVPDRRRGGVDALSNLGEVQHHRDHALSGRKDALAHRHVRPITRIIGRVGRLRGGYALPTLGRSGKLSWCSNGLTGAEVQIRLAMGASGRHFLRPNRAASCWTGQSLQCVWTLLGLAVFKAVAEVKLSRQSGHPAMLSAAWRCPHASFWSASRRAGAVVERPRSWLASRPCPGGGVQEALQDGRDRDWIRHHLGGRHRFFSWSVWASLTSRRWPLIALVGSARCPTVADGEGRGHDQVGGGGAPSLPGPRLSSRGEVVFVGRL